MLNPCSRQSSHSSSADFSSEPENRGSWQAAVLRAEALAIVARVGVDGEVGKFMAVQADAIAGPPRRNGRLADAAGQDIRQARNRCDQRMAPAAVDPRLLALGEDLREQFLGDVETPADAVVAQGDPAGILFKLLRADVAQAVALAGDVAGQAPDVAAGVHHVVGPLRDRAIALALEGVLDRVFGGSGR